MENSGNRTLKHIFDVFRSVWCSETPLVFFKTVCNGVSCNFPVNHKCYTFLEGDWFEDHVFSTNLLVIGLSVMV